MATKIYDTPVFGPVRSRRLGLSLGINLLPADGKVCSFDCLYCECGLNEERRPTRPLPTREEVWRGLEAKLAEMQQEGECPDVLTFAGNGEPTLHPDFAMIIDDTLLLRDRLCPQAKVSVLSNATRIWKSEVHATLLRVDNNIQKLDTVSEEYIRLLDRPVGRYQFAEVIENLKCFNGHVIIQTLFLKGCYQGFDLNNTTDEYVLPWIDTLHVIRPSQVMIYTIDRDTPISTLQKATPDELNRILALLQAAGFAATASY
jgi:wyosine [tRNA(Phe)-imidazoG37] synthetase (radical SAM superfamily)